MAIYIDIMNEIAEEIKNGRFQQGAPLPSEERLRKRFNASRTSVRNALNILQKEGFIEKRRGSGNFVKGSFGEVGIKPPTARILVDIHDDYDNSSFFTNRSNILKLKGINSVFKNGGGNIEMTMFHRDSDDLESEVPMENGNAGYIDTGNVMDDDAKTLLHSRNAKIVRICSRLSNVASDSECASVINDPEPAIRVAAKLYAESGKKSFGYAALAENGLKNLRIYEKALASLGLEFDYDAVVVHPKSAENYMDDIEPRAASIAERLLKKDGTLPEVIFHDGTFLLNALMREVSRKAHRFLRKTAWCGVGLSFDEFDEEFAGMVDLVAFQYGKAGEAAAVALLKWLKTGAKPFISKRIPAVFNKGCEK